MASRKGSAEALLRDYLERGESAFDDARGAISCAVLDGRRKQVWLMRDRTGVRPLFYASAGRVLVAGSSATDVLAVEGVSRELNAVAIAEWLGGVLAAPDETLFAGLHRVPAGHGLIGSEHGLRMRRAWEPPPAGARASADAAEFGSTLEQAVARALENGPGAVFLSGGIDSAAVTVAAARASRALGVRAPLALSVEIAGASEAETQRRVAAGLEIPQRFATAEAGGLVRRALERVKTALWPVGAVWQPAFDDLAREARDDGYKVVLDGQGGDELLDVTPAQGAELARRLRFGDVARLVAANRTYTGVSTLRSLRQVLGSLRPRVPQPRTLPPWLAPDPALRRSLTDRLAPPPRTLAEVHQIDVLDPYLAHAREETFDAGRRHGIAYRHPYWDAEVVELLHALPPEAFLAGGDPKSPARTYVRGHAPAISGRWPRPAVADELIAAVVAQEGKLAWAELGGPKTLHELGILDPTHPFEGYSASNLWVILCVEQWLRSHRDRGEV